MGRGCSLSPNPTLYVFAILFILVFSEKLITIDAPKLELSAILAYLSLTPSLSQVFETEQSAVNEK